MSTPGDAPDELDRLLAALVDGELSHAEQQHLAALLRDDPARQKQYRDYLLLDAMLRWETTEPATPAPSRLSRRRWLWAAVATVAAVALLAVTLWPRPDGTPHVAKVPVEPTDDSVAVLLHAAGAEWDDTAALPRSSGSLVPGRFRLKAGFAHIEFYSGATVIFEGPAEFELISRDRAACTRGKLRATVPPHAQGFTIDTPGAALVDRGTEFGLNVVGADKTEVHVFVGQVDVYEPKADRTAAPKRELTTGQGMRLDVAGAADIRPDPAAFRTARDLEARRTTEAARRRKEWLAAQAVWNADPALVLHFPFHPEHPLDRALRANPAGGRAGRDGTIVGCSWVAGRWAGEQALEFKRVSDRVRLNIPGEFESLTMTTWVCFDGLPNRNNSLLMADGWDDGGMHWQVGSDGTAILGVQDLRQQHRAHYRAPRAVMPERYGQWMHLAVVYDREAAQVAHYIDGRVASQETILTDVRLRIGNAELGNWNVGTFRSNTPIRFLSGRMDEFMLFARALSEQEVERLYAQGQPPQ